jgi:glycine/D-amino acid oxidase-like deaminating enzyme
LIGEAGGRFEYFWQKERHMRIKKLPIDTGPAAWTDLLQPKRMAPALEADMTADWVIVGAGFAGLTAAHRLSELAPEARVIVLEATGIGQGPAGRNSGFMIDLPHDLASEDYGGSVVRDQLQTKDNRMAISYAKEMVARFSLDREAFDPCGKTNAAATEKGHAHNVSYAAHLDAMGEPYQMLDAADMRDLTGGGYYIGGLYTPGTVILQPGKYIRGIAAGIMSNRVQVFENSPVVALEKEGGAWVVTTPQGKVRAGGVILAVNGHLENFGYKRGRLMHVFTYASMTRELTPEEVVRIGGQPSWGVTPADPLGTTVRKIAGTGGHRIVIRNRFTFDPSLEVNEARMAEVARDHRKSFDARFPMISGTEMEYVWGGRLCLSYNDVQVVQKLDDWLFSACVQNGLGTVKGTLAGKLAADMALGEKSDALTRAMSAPEPSRLPPKPIAALGAKIRLRWGEYKAGAEF